MIIYGTRAFQKIASTHEFHCPRCGVPEEGHLKYFKRWFTLYFIPLIPVGRFGEHVECQGCRGVYAVEVLDYDPATQAAGRLGSEIARDFRLAPLPQGTGFATSSLVFGLFAFFTSWLLLLSAPLALIAVACGHFALSKIKRSAGRLTGRGLAIAGLVLGYGSLASGIYSYTGQLNHAPVEKSHEQSALADAVKSISDRNTSNPYGNTDESRHLSSKFATEMGKIDQQLFAGDVKRRSSAAEYRTWCELHDGRCAFVVQVPDYRKMNKLEKKVIAMGAWAAAQSVASEKLKPGDQLAVGLRGLMLYGAVIVGTVGEPFVGDGLGESKDAEQLLPFFRADAAPSAPTDDTPNPLPNEPRNAKRNEPSPAEAPEKVVMPTEPIPGGPAPSATSPSTKP